MTLNPTRHVKKKLNQPKDKIRTISMTVKIMNQIDEVIDAPGGWPMNPGEDRGGEGQSIRGISNIEQGISNDEVRFFTSLPLRSGPKGQIFQQAATRYYCPGNGQFSEGVRADFIYLSIFATICGCRSATLCCSAISVFKL